MDFSYLDAHSLVERKKVIKTINLKSHEVLGFYTYLSKQDETAFELIFYSLSNNIGELISSKQDSINTLISLIESAKSLEIIALYTKYEFQSSSFEFEYVNEHHLQKIAENLFLKAGRYTMIHLSRLLMSGKLQALLEIEARPGFRERDVQIAKLITRVGKYMFVEGELNVLLLRWLNKLVIFLQIQPIIKELTSVIIGWILSPKNHNSDHDKLQLIQEILLLAFSGHTYLIPIILAEINQEQLTIILQSNLDFIIHNYFQDKQYTQKIFQGLTSIPMSLQVIQIIFEISTGMIQHYCDSCYHSLRVIQELFIVRFITQNLMTIPHLGPIFHLFGLFIIGQSHIKLPIIFYEKCRQLVKIRPKAKPFVNILMQTMVDHDRTLKQDEQITKLTSMTYYKGSCSYRFQTFYPNYEVSIQSASNIQPIAKQAHQFVGLQNLGSTCFMNSFLQCLFINSTFRNFIISMRDEFNISFLSDSPNTNPLVKALIQLFIQMLNLRQGYCCPYNLKKALRAPYGNTNQQQDVSEFALHFLEDISNAFQKEQQIQEMFFGKQQSILKCSNSLCNKQFTINETIQGLNLHFQRQNSQLQQEWSIEKMIRQSFDEEYIDFRCDGCNQNSNTNVRQLKLITLPPVLMINLHRFTYDPLLGERTKILTKVPLEFDIDMRTILGIHDLDQKSSQYKLFAFIVHLGEKADSGHYTTYARQLLDHQTNQWIDFDDTTIKIHDVQHQYYFEKTFADEECPYILFYQNISKMPLQFNIQQ